MKTRKWVIILSILFALLAMTILSLRYIGVSRIINSIVLYHLRPILGANASVESVDLKLNSITLYQLAYQDPQSGIEVKSRRVRFNLKLLNGLIYGFSPVNFVDEIQVEQLEANIPMKKAKSSAEGASVSPSYQIPWKLASKYPSIKKINFTDCSIYYDTYAVKHLFGYVDLKSAEDIKCSFSGASLSDSTNLDFSAEILTDEEKITFSLRIHPTKVDSLYSINPSLTFVGGLFAIDLQGDFSDSGLELSGGADLNQLKFILNDSLELFVEQVSLFINDDTLKAKGSGEFAEVPFSFKGQGFNFLKPWLDVQVTCPQLELARFAWLADSSLKLTGSCQAQARIQGELSALKIEFQASSQYIAYDKIKFTNASISGVYRNDIVHLNSYKCHSLGGLIKGSGSLSVGKNGVVLDLNADYRGKPELAKILPQVEKYKVDSLVLSARIQGTPANPRIAALYDIYPLQKVKRLTGEIEYQNQTVTIVEAGGAGDSLNLKINFAGEKPLFSARAQNLHYLIIGSENIPAFLNGSGYTSSIEAMGSLEDFSLKFGARTDEVDLKLNAKVSLSKLLKVIGGYNFTVNDTNEVAGDIAFRFREDTLFLDNFTIGEEFYGWGAVDIRNSELIGVRGRGEDFPLQKLLRLAGIAGWSNFNGDLKFEMGLSGKFTSPKAEASCYLSQGEMFGVGGYWASAAGTLEENKFKIVVLDFGNMANMLLSGRGYIDLNNREIDFRSALDDFMPELLINSFTGKKGILSGKGGYSIQATGTIEKPVVEFGFMLQDGAIFKVPFDQLAGGAMLESTSESKYNITIPEFRIIKNGGYDIGIRGNVPFNGEEIKISISAQGHLLAILKQMGNAFNKGSGLGMAEIEIGGTADSPRITKAVIKVNNGILVPKSIVDKIENIKLDAALEDNFLHIKELSGTINKVPFNISNTPQVVTADGPLEPWVVSSIGLNLGIFIIDTGKDGLKVALPGFVAPGETAHLSLAGKNPNEKAYIAGPEDSPVVRGKLIVRNGVIAYPPPPMKKTKGKKDAGTRLLERINWDLEVIPDRGNTYLRDMSGMGSEGIIKDISGLFSNVQVDLSIDRRVEGIKLKGSIDDTTFGISGEFVSSRGTVSLLDIDFQLQRFTVEFEPTEKLPLVQGYATTSIRDSLGRDITITLRVAKIDPITGRKEYIAHWDDFTFVLEDDLGDSQEQILSYLGYDISNLGNMVTNMPLKAVDQAFFGAWLTKLEREIKNVLGIDYVNINPAVAQNLLEDRLLSSTEFDTVEVDWRTRYLKHSRFTVGKYLTDDLFFTYTGRFEGGESPLDQRYRLGIIHTWNLEFRLPTKGANLLMIMGYEYDNLENKADRSVSIRYTFSF